MTAIVKVSCIVHVQAWFPYGRECVEQCRKCRRNRERVCLYDSYDMFTTIWKPGFIVQGKFNVFTKN